MKLSEYARQHDVTWRTAYRWYQDGKIPGAHKTPGGSIIVTGETSNDEDGKTVIYARVSNASRRKTDLEYQAERLTNYAIANGWTIDKVIKEVGSGLNDQRSQLNKLLKSNENISRIIVEHKDRLTRFGYGYIKIIAELKGIDIIIVNPTIDDKNDLLDDLVSIITSFTARIYGQRRSKRKTDALTRELLEEGNNDTHRETGSEQE